MGKSSSTILESAQYTISELTDHLGVNLKDGLSTAEAKERLEDYGPNSISSRETHWWNILGRQFKSPFVYLLIGALVLSAIFGEFIDALMIGLFIVINAGLGFYQEFRSDKSLKLLKSYITKLATIRRDNQEISLPTEQLVPGDIIILKAGDLAPADIRIIEAEQLTINESILTGESIAVVKTPDAIKEPIHDLYEATNSIYSGTTVLSGDCIGIVIATGKTTALGSIATLTAETTKESEFTKGIGKFSSFILRLIAITIVLIVIANILIKPGETNIIELLIFSIALTISVIPEGLPLVLSFSLSRGALRLAKKHVVVKRLSAIEDLGGIEILCTDKTGTITQNVLTVVDQFSVEANTQNLLYANLAITAQQAEILDPFDTALRQALPNVQAEILKKYSLLQKIPFDPQRRRNTVMVKNEQGTHIITRGALENVLACCSTTTNEAVTQWAIDQGKQGRRVLGLAIKSIDQSTIQEDVANQEHDLQFVGCIAFEDPIKDTTLSAVKQAEELGINIKIVTGDAAEVSGAVAKQVGLINDASEVMTGAELMALSHAEQLEALEKYSVFARVAPEHKHHIISLLQENHAVGFLGEGINDAPALKAAGVSLVVANASDIAREAADIVLLQTSLSVIIDGIKDGRKIFANTIKYIKATLASNFGNFYAVAISSLFINFLPMLSIQILLLNLLSDFPMIAIATDTVDDAEIRKPLRYDVKDIALIATLLGLVSMVFDFLFFAMYVQQGEHILQTNWYIASIITELAFLFSIRSKRFALFAKAPSWPIIILSGMAFLLTIIIPFTQVGQTVFKFIQPQWQDILTIIGLVLVYFVITEVVKVLYYRKFQNGGTILAK